MPLQRNQMNLWHILHSHLYKIPCTGLRFFTVYGPYGRSDMAYFKFADAINNGKPIDVYNNGRMKRDFYLHRRHHRGTLESAVNHSR